MVERCESCGQPLNLEERAFGVRRCTRCTEIHAEAAPLQTDTAWWPEYASFWSRLGAYVLDAIGINVVGLALAFGVGFLAGLFAYLFGSNDDAASNAAVGAGVVAAIAFSWGYLWVGNGLGGTPGKRLGGLAVVGAADGRNIGIRRGLLRAVIQVLGSIPLYLGWLWSIWSDQHQAWHDMAANSVVVLNPVADEPVSQNAGRWYRSRWAVAAAAVVLLFVLALTAGGIAGLASGPDGSFESRLLQAFEREAEEQERIDAIYDYCSPQWSRASAENTVASIDSVVRLQDAEAAITELDASLQTFCADFDVDSYCRDFADVIALRVEGRPPTLHSELEVGCLEGLRGLLGDLVLQVGDCVAYDEGILGGAVDCSEPHDAVVTAAFELPDADYPGEDAAAEYAEEQCPLLTDVYYYPSGESWMLGDRQIVCLDEDQP